ncbi:MAG: isoaspartyl peptidase/L-asparaginase [Leptospirales bacterium]
MDATILLHAGLGTRLDLPSENLFRTILREGKERILGGEAALTVSWALTGLLESSGLFNAGIGAIPQEDGVVRRDIGTMDGKNLKSLGIPGITNLSCPSRILPELFFSTNHVLLSGESTSHWIVRSGHSDLEVAPGFAPDSLRFWEKNMDSPGEGTIGAVVIDSRGHCAATTSTGGTGRMRPGRIGDSSIPGAGYYADDRMGAISMTGTGESILKTVGGFRLLYEAERAPDRETASTELKQLIESMSKETEGRIGGILVSRKNGPFVLHCPGPMLAGAWSSREDLFKVSDTWDPLHIRNLAP